MGARTAPGRRAGPPRLLPARVLPIVLLLGVAVSGCGGRTATGGTWAGEVTPTTTARGCTASRGVATIRGDAVTFAPSEGTWILVGTAEPTGRIMAERITIGADKAPWETRLDGTWSADAVRGTYTTPRCTFAVALRRV